MKKLREEHIKVAVLDHYDESMHAKFCNNNDVDLYIGIYPAEKTEKSVLFYSAKGFESPGGTYFTELFGKHFLALTGNNIKIIGHSERVLRETRMPAVVVRFGPTDELISNSQQLFETLESSVSAWFFEPFFKKFLHNYYFFGIYPVQSCILNENHRFFPKLGITTSEKLKSLYL